jgi:DNA repair photolyase
VTVHFTVTTLDEMLWRKLEPTTAKPRKRLEALRTLRDHGIRAGVFLAPVLPGLTDDPAHLEAVVRAAAEHGAEFVFSQVLRLGPGISEYYLPFLQREFPEHAGQYERLYGTRRNAVGIYTQEIGRRVRELKQQYGMDGERATIKTRPVIEAPLQLSLFG